MDESLTHGGGHGHGHAQHKPMGVVDYTKALIGLMVLIGFLQLMEIFASTEGTGEERVEQLEHYGIFLLLFLLLVSLIIGWYIEIKEVSWIGEAGGALLVGVVAGGIIRANQGNEGGIGVSASQAAEEFQELEHIAKFDTNFFFLFLLPPIILESGFNMDKMQRRKLFQNMGAVCGFAFIGTMMSTILIALMVFHSQAPAVVIKEHGPQPSAGVGMTMLESMIFGSLISATDPVTVLAIFGKMGADRDLYALVFGESVLNDAVAIVLYKTFSTFNPHTCRSAEEITNDWDKGEPPCQGGMDAVMSGVGKFTYIFIGSVFVGCFIAALSALTFKHTTIFHEEHFVVENVLLFVFPYMAWMLAESLELSGIVAILFCGFGMAHYTALSLSKETEISSKTMFRVMAFGCESFVFVYMGLAMFSFEQDEQVATLVFVAIAAMLISRACQVFPLCMLINCRRPVRRHIRAGVQMVVWFSGLRGGIAFALALQAKVDFGCRVKTCIFNEATKRFHSAVAYNTTVCSTNPCNATTLQYLQVPVGGDCMSCMNENYARTGACPQIDYVPCRNVPTGRFPGCACPATETGAGAGILTTTLFCVLFTVLGVGGVATPVMSYFKVIGLTKEMADTKQKREEQEDYAIMMAERKDSKTLNVDKMIIKPFLTWKGTNDVRDPLRIAHEAAALEAARILGDDITGGGHEGVGSFTPTATPREDEGETVEMNALGPAGGETAL